MSRPLEKMELLGAEKAILHHQTASQERPRCAGLFMLTTYVCY